MINFPADERTISEVERGRCLTATRPLPPGESLAPGDPVLFALAAARPGAEPAYVKGGDAVVVLLTGVTDLGQSDPQTGHPLVRLDWGAPGPGPAPSPAPGRRGRTSRPPVPA